MAIETGNGNDEYRDQTSANSQSTSRRFAERLHEGVDRAAEQGERLERRLSEGREHLNEEAHHLGAGVLDFVRANPWAALGGSIAIGYLLGALSRHR